MISADIFFAEKFCMLKVLSYADVLLQIHPYLITVEKKIFFRLDKLFLMLFREGD